MFEKKKKRVWLYLINIVDMTIYVVVGGIVMLSTR